MGPGARAAEPLPMRRKVPGWTGHAGGVSEHLASRGDGALRERAHAYERALAYDGADIDGGVDARLDIVPDDRPELPPAGTGLLAVHDHHDLLLVQAQVRDLRACAEVAPLADDAVPDIAQVRHLGAVHDDGVLDLHGVADLAPIAYGCGRADVGVRAYDAVLAYDGRADDIP